MTLITAHTGCEDTPLNSMRSLYRGIARGADAVEVDVRLDGGTLFLAHDVRSDYTGAATLREAFDAIRGTVTGINCDLKTADALLPVLALAEEMGVTHKQLMFSGSVKIDALLHDRAIGRRGRFFLNSEVLCAYCRGAMSDRGEDVAFMERHAGEIADLMREISAVAVNMPYQYLTGSCRGALKQAGVALSLWTVDAAEAIETCLSWEPVNITTNHVQDAVMAREALKL